MIGEGLPLQLTSMKEKEGNRRGLPLVVQARGGKRKGKKREKGGEGREKEKGVGEESGGKRKRSKLTFQPCHPTNKVWLIRLAL